ncbi:MAG: AtpZ/AtpI family protein [Rickettsiales bacterium]|nr:AtpZ/AtpI family protein [Rickettsiales bacterium]
MNIRDLRNRIEKYKNNHLVSQERRINHYKVSSSVICMEIVASVGTGVFIGHILDHYFNTKYIFKVVCLVFAFIACFIVLYKLVKD